MERKYTCLQLVGRLDRIIVQRFTRVTEIIIINAFVFLLAAIAHVNSL